MALQREEKHSKVLDKKIKELWDGSFVCKQSSDNLKCARTEQEKKKKARRQKRSSKGRFGEMMKPASVSRSFLLYTRKIMADSALCVCERERQRGGWKSVSSFLFPPP